ncbi:MAG: family 10 glycosylhydrolase [Ignavibacteriales bacterium]|nr:family 10 glycosylhydrolase [Ignavibacteriales bacterium]
MRVLLLCVVAVALFTSVTFGQTKYPKREFRGAWLATVANLDWPTSGASPSSQQAALIGILDRLKTNGINAVIFQIRPECDALYPSAIEPWSRWLTGTQGVAPNPLWDPLQFAIDESHKRGMELHAWFNPYRAEKAIGAYPLAASHVVNMHPDWILTFPSSSLKILNPGLLQVRNFVASVTADIVRRYNVDGIHADDYFYPYSPKISWEDTATFRQNSRGFTNINDWRRDNVNLLMKAVMDSLLVIRPNVKFGMSPFGIWKNGTPAGISGMDNYNDLFADPVAWMQNKWVDYITPQLYWKFGGSQDYGKLCSWWATMLNGRHFYTGNAPFHVTDGSFNATELPRQMRYNRTVSGVGGAIHFRANDGINNNPQGFADSLRNDLYKYPALPPTMLWKDSIPPGVPAGLTATVTPGIAIVLNWQKPAIASDGDTARYYVVYRAQYPDTIDYSNPQYIRAITNDASTRYADVFTIPANTRYTYAVTACDKLHNESVVAVKITTPTGVEMLATGPLEFRLAQNYPNPFNPSTIVNYSLAQSGFTTLKVYDLLGREVSTLVATDQTPGVHSVEFSGASLSSGVYLYRLVSGSFAETKRMILQK